MGFLFAKNPEVVVSFLGVAKAGGMIFPVDYNQPVSQIEYILNLTQPFALIVSSGFLQLVAKLKLPESQVKIIVVGATASEENFSWEEIVSRECEDVPDHDIKEDDPVYLNFTSGSTGTPKGAVTTHANIYWNTKAIIDGFGLTSDDVYLCGFPVFSHPHEIFSWSFYAGGTAVLTDDVLPENDCLRC